MNGVIHDFRERLEFSANLSDEPSWVEFYRRLWPDMLLAVRIDADCQQQRWGIDRKILLPTGREMLIDEKKRERNKTTGRVYDDFACEEWSLFFGEGSPKNKVGWTLDRSKRCDWIAYAIPELHKCYMLPFELLRLTCSRNLPAWKVGNSARVAPNKGYQTLFWPVTWDRLFASMKNEMKCDFGAAKLILPTPIIDVDQLCFGWK